MPRGSFMAWGPGGLPPTSSSACLIQVLKSTVTQKCAGDLAYEDKTLAIDDAVLAGHLHIWLSGWSQADIALQSGDTPSASASLWGNRSVWLRGVAMTRY
ncbi:TPA: hypothetical protein ACH3X1_004173 [Trebouxia sp. C0004]